MDVLKARRANLRKLIADRNWSQAGAAKELGIAPPQVSQILSGTRNMGEAVARRIEIAAGLPMMSLDAETALFSPNRNVMEVRERAAAYEVELQDRLIEHLASQGIYYDEIELDARVMTEFGPVRIDYLIRRDLAVYVINEGSPQGIDRVLGIALKMQHQVSPQPYRLFILVTQSHPTSWAPRPELVRRQLEKLKEHGHIAGWSDKIEDLP